MASRLDESPKYLERGAALYLCSHRASVRLASTSASISNMTSPDKEPHHGPSSPLSMSSHSQHQMSPRTLDSPWTHHRLRIHHLLPKQSGCQVSHVGHVDTLRLQAKGEESHHSILHHTMLLQSNHWLQRSRAYVVVMVSFPCTSAIIRNPLRPLRTSNPQLFKRP